MKEYLKSTNIIESNHSAILRRARTLASGHTDPVVIAKRCFEWVRDNIKHSGDFQMNPITCSASEVLESGTGFCYAKSHLLAALLRANHIPAGLCYQRRRRDDGKGYALHGLNAVHLPGLGWYRIDPRGNKKGVDTQFSPPEERLAWTITHEGECDLPEIWADPLPIVIDCLRKSQDYNDVLDNNPDVELIGKR